MGLSTLYSPKYDQLCELLGPEWQPYSGARTPYEQGLLWAMGRVKTGPIVTWARPGLSPHNYGCATDWTMWDGTKPIWLLPGDPRWCAYQKACEHLKLRWGNDWNSNGDIGDEHHPDAFHNELKIGCGWEHVYEIYSKNGMRAAMEHIERNLAI